MSQELSFIGRTLLERAVSQFEQFLSVKRDLSAAELLGTANFAYRRFEQALSNTKASPEAMAEQVNASLELAVVSLYSALAFGGILASTVVHNIPEQVKMVMKAMKTEFDRVRVAREN